MSDTFTVSRSETISAPPAAVFDKLVDLREWEAWSPWASMDPNMTTTYSGDAGSLGSGSHWVGNRKVGEGRMKITGIDPSNSLDIDLSFVKPFKAENTVRFDVEQDGDTGSRVTWSMSGQNTFMTRVMGLFGKTMDKMVGPDFEKGLASLKGVVEAG